MLNTNSPIPLYHQLAEVLLNRIREGEYQAGEKIPSEPQLARTYKIGRPTVRQAIDILARRRIVERKRGSGTFVCSQPDEVNLFSLAGTTSAFFEKGKSMQTRIIEPTSLIRIGPDKVNPFAKQESFFYSRLTIVDQAPVLIEDMYLHRDLFPGFESIEIENQSLARIVKEAYYMTPTSCKQNFTVTKIGKEKAHWLDLKPNTPVLLVHRFLHFPQTENAIYSKLFCRTDKFVFSQTIKGQSND